MSKPYDATGKDLFESDPAGWAALFGVTRPPKKVRLVDSDLSAVTAAADKVARIDDDPPWLLHVEFQSSRDLSISRRMWKYNTLLHDRHGVAVATVLVLLTPDADASELTGFYEVKPPFGPGNSFGYTVIRVWELPTEELLKGPLALLPLAPVSNVAASDLQGVVVRTAERLRVVTNPTTANELWTAIGFLLKLRYGAMNMEVLMERAKEIERLEGHHPFRKYLDEGARLSLQQLLIRQGRKKFGELNPEMEAEIRSTEGIDKLEELFDRLSNVNSWDELLRSP